MLAWQFTALFGAISLAVGNVLDSYLISKRLGSLRLYMFLTAISMGVVAIILFILNLPVGVPIGYVIASFGICLIRVGFVIILYYVMKSQAVSKAIPVTSISPIFVAILAVVFLGEVISGAQWLAIVLVVVGTILISLRGKKTAGGGNTLTAAEQLKAPKFLHGVLKRPVLMLLFAAFILSIADILTKQVSPFVGAETMFSILTIDMAVVFLLISARRPVIAMAKEAFKSKLTVFLVLLVCALIMLGRYFMLYSIEHGEVAIASALLGSRPLWTLLISFTAAHIFKGTLYEEHATKDVIIKRFIATALIVAGLLIIYLIP